MLERLFVWACWHSKVAAPIRHKLLKHWHVSVWNLTVILHMSNFQLFQYKVKCFKVLPPSYLVFRPSHVWCVFHPACVEWISMALINVPLLRLNGLIWHEHITLETFLYIFYTIKTNYKCHNNFHEAQVINCILITELR